jgi:two-component system LytT family response regulator
MINAIIVDDEPYCCEALQILLERYCPQVKVTGTFHSAKQALEPIREGQPQLLFLDIEMPRMNGFELLEKVRDLNFGLIFTTSYDQYAIRAIRHSALDYLLKPIDREELQLSIRKAEQRLTAPSPEQINLLFQKLQSPSGQFSKIAIPTMEGFQMVAIGSIIHCTSDSNYTTLTLKDKQKVVASRTLKEIEELLEDYSFIRVHHSHLINLNEVYKYIKGEGGYLLMSDGASINVSRSKKEGLLRRLQPNRY